MLFGLFKTKNEKKLEILKEDVADLTHRLSILEQQLHYIFKRYIDVPPEDVPFFMESRMSDDPVIDYTLGDVIHETREV